MSEANVLETGRTARYFQVAGVAPLQNSIVGIVGCGAVGRALALQLTSLGARLLQIYDFDNVSEENLGTQGYGPGDVRQAKVDVTISDIKRLNPYAESEGFNQRYQAGHGRHHILVLCPDNMVARNEVRQKKHQPEELLVDCRLALHAVHVISDVPPFKYWKSTLFDDKDAPPAKCGLQMVVNNAQIAAGLAIAHIFGFYRRMGFQPAHWFLDTMNGSLMKLKGLGCLTTTEASQPSTRQSDDSSGST